MILGADMATPRSMDCGACSSRDAAEGLLSLLAARVSFSKR